MKRFVHLLFVCIFCSISLSAFAEPSDTQQPPVPPNLNNPKPSQSPVLSGRPVTLQNFSSVLVTVNTNGQMDSFAEDILVKELQVLRVSAVTEEMAWELYKMIMSSDDVAKYQMYLHESYDTALVCNIRAKGERYYFHFEILNYRDVSLPKLFTLELQSEGPKDVTYQGVFRAFVQNIAYERNMDFTKLNESEGRKAQ